MRPSPTYGALLLAALIASWAPSSCAGPTPSPTDASTNDDFKEPFQVLSKNGRLTSPLHVVFGSVEIPGAPEKLIDPDAGTGSEREPVKVDVRSYSLPDDDPTTITPPMIPGPTFVFKPGELVRLRFENHLDRSSDPGLNTIQNNPQVNGNPAAADDTDEHVSHEISIPNDSNVTNLHVHGLHVDPKQDDVTLLILPEDSDPGALEPGLQRFVPNINRWWTRTYQYKLPLDHLPGTFWYHAHKHGSTSTQVENGMAGALHIRPRTEEEALVPGLWNADPDRSHDRLMVLQQITNFGVQQGATVRQSKKSNLTKPVTTINGRFEPTLNVPPNQVERWRFVVAGANHGASSYVWVGRMDIALSDATQKALAAVTDGDSHDAYTKDSEQKTLLPDSTVCSCLTMPGVVKLVAVDGITIKKPVDVTPSRPALGGAGNRLDLLVQPSDGARDAQANAGAKYRIYKNYPVHRELAERYPDLFGDQLDPTVVNLRYDVLVNGTAQGGMRGLVLADPESQAPIPPADLNTDPFGIGAVYTGLEVKWARVLENGDTFEEQGAGSELAFTPTSVAPILGGIASGSGVRIDENFWKRPRWQPMYGAGGGNTVPGALLVKLDVSGEATGRTTLPPDLMARVARLSPAGDAANTLLKKVDPVTRKLVPGVPSYVAPFEESDIEGRQVAVFDRGMFTFNYVNKANRTQQPFRQFWINGRQFGVDDWIGNPGAQELIRKPLANVEPSLGDYSPNAAEGLWTHETQIDGMKGMRVTNPGYTLPVMALDTEDGPVYTYDYEASVEPTYADVTGLDEARTPVSTTAEEWLLINNSDLFHPFHIHISPFLVTEIGQLDYAPRDGAKPGEIDVDPELVRQQWTLKKLDPKGPFGWVVGNWWDVITLPPHGYVKMRTWINVPSQLPVDKTDPDSDLTVEDNANVYGSWVMHCHILRHEDRGMMSMVNTRPKELNLTDTWTCSAAPDRTEQMEIADDHGSLNVTGSGRSPGRGNFNRGIGNPLILQPFLGSISRPTQPVSSPTNYEVISFCVTGDGSKLLDSNGSYWGRGEAAPAVAAPATNFDLSGVWIDGGGNAATIRQAAPGPDGMAELSFEPGSSVWWSSGIGSWSPPGQRPTGQAGSGRAGSGRAGSGRGRNTAVPATTRVFAGTQLLVSNDRQNQQINFCVSLDLDTLVFSNGVEWTRKK